MPIRSLGRSSWRAGFRLDLYILTTSGDGKLERSAESLAEAGTVKPTEIWTYPNTALRLNTVFQNTLQKFGRSTAQAVRTQGRKVGQAAVFSQLAWKINEACTENSFRLEFFDLELVGVELKLVLE